MGVSDLFRPHQDLAVPTLVPSFIGTGAVRLRPLSMARRASGSSPRLRPATPREDGATWATDQFGSVGRPEE